MGTLFCCQIPHRIPIQLPCQLPKRCCCCCSEAVQHICTSSTCTTYHSPNGVPISGPHNNSPHCSTSPCIKSPCSTTQCKHLQCNGPHCTAGACSIDRGSYQYGFSTCYLPDQSWYLKPTRGHAACMEVLHPDSGHLEQDCSAVVLI